MEIPPAAWAFRAGPPGTPLPSKCACPRCFAAWVFGVLHLRQSPMTTKPSVAKNAAIPSVSVRSNTRAALGTTCR